MGQVFLGRSAGGRLVAIKVIRPDLAGEPGFRVRFSREVAAARHVSGLFTALVVDADAEGPMPWMATAYVAGPSLDEAVATQGPLPVDSVLALAAGLAEGLQAIHAAGVVHRDLKPSNVLLADDGPRVIDFGISRAAEATALTQTGAVMGSPGFMSPEQAEGREVGPPSDVFSLGAVLAFAATGEGPFGTGSFPALMFRVVHHEPNIGHLPAQIRPVIQRCLAKDPGQRPTPGDVLAELGEGHLAADWLPPPITEVVGRYRPSGLLAAAGFGTHDSQPARDTSSDSPPPAGVPATPPTIGASIPQRPSRPAAQTEPVTTAGSGAADGGAAGPPPQRRNRRRLVWVAAAAAAVVVAASASAATALSTHGSRHSSTTPPPPSSKVSASASAHPRRSSSPTVSPSAAASGFAQNQPTTGQSSPTPTPTPTTTTTPTPTTTPTATTTPTSTPTSSTPATSTTPPPSPTS